MNLSGFNSAKLLLLICVVVAICVFSVACNSDGDGGDGTVTSGNEVTTTQESATNPTTTTAKTTTTYCNTTTAKVTTTYCNTTTAKVTTTAKPTTTAPFASPIIPETPAGSKITRGTPTIDGVMDKEYLTSFRYTELPLINLNYSPYGKKVTADIMKNTHGFVYYLYDDDYLYVCITVYDETLCSRGETWRNNTQWPWSDDGAEIYLWFSRKDNMAIHSDAHNIRSVRDVHIEPERVSDEVYTDTPREDWCAKIGEDGKSYVIELRVELPEYVASGSKIGTLLEINDRFDITKDNRIGALFKLPRYAGADNFLVELE